MMIGGGSDGWNRAIGVTEASNAGFGTGDCDGDFGDSCSTPTSYSLNFWIKYNVATTCLNDVSAGAIF